MCGIVGYVGPRFAQDVLLAGLARLEYRGYDSAGIATLTRDASGAATHLRRARGRLSVLEAALKAGPCSGFIGIGHTRWATHGPPNVMNAHPHHAHGITVVHNGILEDHDIHRRQLEAEGHVFSSDTDTEVFAHLLARAKLSGATPLRGLQSVLRSVRGAYALAILDERMPQRIYFARSSSPLVLGRRGAETFLASDGLALGGYADSVVLLEEGDHGYIEAGAVYVEGANGEAQQRAWVALDAAALTSDKGAFSTYMEKEICEQPARVAEALSAALSGSSVTLPGVDVAALAVATRARLVACGTSRFAGMLGAWHLERLAGLPAAAELASELRGSDPLVEPGTIAVGISQSGETADTLGALTELRERGATVLGIVNVETSALARACRAGLGFVGTKAGAEVGVASTKAWTSQVVAMHLLALATAEQRGVDPARVDEDRRALEALPGLISAVLAQAPELEAFADALEDARSALYLGRGPMHAVAAEGALKLKEIAYVHAEAYAAGEMKHGPIALIDENMPVVVLCPEGRHHARTIANLEEVKARKGVVLALGTVGDTRLEGLAHACVLLPAAPESVAPILYGIALQIVAHRTATRLGRNVDRPRNLAKSVTVE